MKHKHLWGFKISKDPDWEHMKLRGLKAYTFDHAIQGIFAGIILPLVIYAVNILWFKSGDELSMKDLIRSWVIGVPALGVSFGVLGYLSYLIHKKKNQDQDEN